MKVSEAQRAGVESWVEKWRPRLLLQNHSIGYHWHTKPCRDDTDEKVHHAQAICAFAGFDAELHCYPALWKCTPEIQEKIVLHELVHVVAPSADESEVIQLTEAFWRAYINEEKKGAFG